MACLRCHFAEQQRWDAGTHGPNLQSRSVRSVLCVSTICRSIRHVLVAEYYSTISDCLRAKGSLEPTAIPNQQGLYLNLLETKQAFDTQIGPTGLDLHCGQATGWIGLPLRMKEYEKQSRGNTTFRAQRQLYMGERAKTLHIYMLCSLPGARFHLRVVAVHPEQSRDTREEECLLYDYTLTESALTILLGIIMSAEGQTAYKSPIRWMAMSSEWARTLNCQVTFSYRIWSKSSNTLQPVCVQGVHPLTITTSAIYPRQSSIVTRCYKVTGGVFMHTMKNISGSLQSLSDHLAPCTCLAVAGLP